MEADKLNYNILASGSSGNCVLIDNGKIAMDMGISFVKIKPHLKSLKLIFIQHCHSDHINLNTILKIQYEKPTVRIACGSFLVPFLAGVKNIDILDLGFWYNYGEFRMAVIKGYHDVPTFGARLDIRGMKILFMTDTATMEGITAKDYDYFMLEHNYDEAKVAAAIQYAKQNGEFCYAKDSIKAHLSIEQAFEWINTNKKDDSIVVKLHQSERYS